MGFVVLASIVCLLLRPNAALATPFAAIAYLAATRLSLLARRRSGAGESPSTSDRVRLTLSSLMLASVVILGPCLAFFGGFFCLDGLPGFLINGAAAIFVTVYLRRSVWEPSLLPAPTATEAEIRWLDRGPTPTPAKPETGIEGEIRFLTPPVEVIE